MVLERLGTARASAGRRTMRHASNSDGSRHGRKRQTPLRLLLAVATLFLFGLGSLPGADFSPASAVPPETLADSHRHGPQQAPVSEINGCAAHPAACGVFLSVAHTAFRTDAVGSADSWVLTIPGSGPTPEHNPPPPRFLP